MSGKIYKDSSQLSIFYSEAVDRRVFSKKGALKSSAKFIEKQESGAGVFLWILQNFWKHIFFTEHLWWLLLFILSFKSL